MESNSGMKHPNLPDFFRHLLNSPVKGDKEGTDYFHSPDGYHQMINQIEDYAIVFLSSEGKIENWNKGAERIKGYQPDEVIGKSIAIFYTKQDQQSDLPAKMIALARSKGKAALEGWRVRKDGSRFWGSVLISAVYDENHTVVGFTKITRDLTERKNAEDINRRYTEDLERKNLELEKVNKELQAFAYVSSHDLQEPLRKIQAFSEKIMEREYKVLSEQGKDYLTRMNNAASRMKLLIEDLLSYAQTSIQEGELEEIQLNDLFIEVIDEMNEQVESSGAKIVVEELIQLPVVRFQFKQLLQNLLSNAIKFSPSDVTPVINISGQIQVGIDGEKPQSDVKYYKLTIADNGIGFDMVYQNKIFELFQRLHGRHEFPGTGIGLAICKKIVENHKGAIQVKSKPKEGSEFIVYIPLNAA